MSTKYKATVKGDKEMHGLQIHPDVADLQQKC
jgi:hypothetical protein